MQSQVSVQHATRHHRLWAKAYLTWSIVTINALWFLVIEGRTGLSPVGIYNAGGMTQSSVMAGQWFRMISSMFVHGSLTHIVLNMATLGSLYVVELLLGRWIFLSIYFLSGLVGNILSLIFLPDSVTCGASGAIIGVFGATLYLSIRGIFPKNVRNQLLMLLVVNIIYGFTSPAVDNWAHLGGVITGFLIVYLLAKRPSLKRMSKPIGIVAVSLSVLCLFLAGSM